MIEYLISSDASKYQIPLAILSFVLIDAEPFERGVLSDR